MRRGVLAGALVGVVQGLVTLLLVVSLGAGTDDFGWFAYTPQPTVALTVPGSATPRQEWLLVPLVLAVLGGLAVWLAGLRRPSLKQPGRRPPRRAVAVLGAFGLALVIVTVALAPGRGRPGSWVQLGRFAGGMPRRYSDYGLVATGSLAGPVLTLVLASGLGAAVLVVVVALADGHRWGRIGILVVLARVHRSRSSAVSYRSGPGDPARRGARAGPAGGGGGRRAAQTGRRSLTLDPRVTCGPSVKR